MIILRDFFCAIIKKISIQKNPALRAGFMLDL